MSVVQVLRTETPPLSFRDRHIKMPSTENAIFSELLPEVAVRRVRGNSTLYSVAYRRSNKKSGKKRSGVSSPLIVTVYQSDLRAKKFRALLKMRVDVRLTTDEHSYRYGVAVAVDEVAACVYVVYTRDEPMRSARLQRLLLRQVKLTLAAADARGVCRLQWPNAPRKPSSVTFEAKDYSREAVACNPFSFLICAARKAETRLSVQQLVLDGATLLLFVNLGFGSYRRGSFELKGVTPATAQLKLRKKNASIDVQIRGDVWGAVRGAGQHKFLLQAVIEGPLKGSESDRAPVGELLIQLPSLLKLGSVADAACPFVVDVASITSGVCQQLVGDQSVDSWVPFGSKGRWLIFCCCCFDKSATIVAARGLCSVARQKIVSVRSADMWTAMQAWACRHPSFAPVVDLPRFQVVSGWLLVPSLTSKSRNPSSPKSIILLANLRSLLPPSTVCAACRVKLSTGSKMCKVCHIRGFGKYSWVFGCHFCSAACLRNAWPTHSLLHKTPPLRKWTDADWQKWRRDKPEH